MDAPHRQRAKDSLLASSLPSSSIRDRLPSTRSGPFFATTILPSDWQTDEGAEPALRQVRAPLGHRSTARIISSEQAPFESIQGLLWRLKTWGRLVIQFLECMHFSGFQTTTISPLVYSFINNDLTGRYLSLMILKPPRGGLYIRQAWDLPERIDNKRHRLQKKAAASMTCRTNPAGDRKTGFVSR